MILSIGIIILAFISAGVIVLIGEVITGVGILIGAIRTPTGAGILTGPMDGAIMITIGIIPTIITIIGIVTMADMAAA